MTLGLVLEVVSMNDHYWPNYYCVGNELCHMFEISHMLHSVVPASFKCICKTKFHMSAFFAGLQFEQLFIWSMVIGFGATSFWVPLPLCDPILPCDLWMVRRKRNQKLLSPSTIDNLHYNWTVSWQPGRLCHRMLSLQ